MSSSNEITYFDLHTSGVGYMNRVREVTPSKGRKGKAFWACDINALVGPSDDVSYVRFDTNAVTSDAEHLLRRCKDAVDAKKKVLFAFKLGDLRPETFVRTKGDHVGETAITLKARLLFIGWIKIDGKLVYKAEPKAAPADDSSTAASATQPEVAPPMATVSEDAVSQAVDSIAGGNADEDTDGALAATTGQSF